MDAFANFASDARAFGGGGGFVPSQPADQLGGGGGGGSALKGGGGGGGGEGGKRETSTLRALTVRQLLRGQEAADDAQAASDKAVVDGVEVHNATLVGKITRVEEGGQRTTLTLHDGTGPVEVSKWRTDDEAQQHLAVGSYVRVFGHLRAGAGGGRGGGGAGGGGGGGGMSFHAFAVRPVTDHNEVTYHLLQCVFQHAHLTRGGPGTGKPVSGSGAGGGFGAAAAAAAAPAYGVGAYGAAAPSAAPAAAGQGAHQPGSLQEAITAVLCDASVGENGLHVNEVVTRVRAAAAAAAGGGCALAQASLGDVQAALSALMNEALAYTTVDDSHWKTT